MSHRRWNDVVYLLGYICVALHDLILFEKFKKFEKHLWSSVTFSGIERVVRNGLKELTSIFRDPIKEWANIVSINC